MGQLVDGKWSTENILFNHDDKGLYFKRDSVFRDRISNEAVPEFPAEPGRYHLYCAVACPSAHRATLMRTLKKIEPFVTLTNTFSGAWWPRMVIRRKGTRRARDRSARAVAPRALHDRRSSVHDLCDSSNALGRQDAPRR